MISRRSTILFLGALLLLGATGAFAQPTGGWLVVNPGYPTNHGYIQLPSTGQLDFTGKSFTFEAWVNTTGDGCKSLAGSGYGTSAWIGICSNALRSYFAGSGTQYTAGDVPPNDWTHVAVTFDNATKVRRHYVDGELVGEQTETVGFTAPATAWRLYSDSDWEYTPSGAMDEVRIWNVARTTAQIRSTITSTVVAPAANLVAEYALDGNAIDIASGINGTKLGPGGFLTSAIGSGCTTSATQLCVGPSGRYALTATYQTAVPRGVAKVAALTTSESGIFWFFSSTNWELIPKVLNGCGINNRWWVFTAGLTDQHYELEVTDIQRGVTKRYFNYAGTAAQPVQDVNAFATCP